MGYSRHPKDHLSSMINVESAQNLTPEKFQGQTGSPVCVKL